MKTYLTSQLKSLQAFKEMIVSTLSHLRLSHHSLIQSPALPQISPCGWQDTIKGYTWGNPCVSVITLHSCRSHTWERTMVDALWVPKISWALVQPKTLTDESYSDFLGQMEARRLVPVQASASSGAVHQHRVLFLTSLLLSGQELLGIEALVGQHSNLWLLLLLFSL